MRRPREKKSGATYHAIGRINRQEMIFVDIIKELFLWKLKQAKLKYSFIIKNFCIMGNHVHLIIKPLENSDLSEIMQWVLGNFAREYNGFMGYKGHVWYDRFKSVIIENEKQMYRTQFYIWNNPHSINEVKDVRNYEYSGFYHLKTGRRDILEPPDNETYALFDLFMHMPLNDGNKLNIAVS